MTKSAGVNYQYYWLQGTSNPGHNPRNHTFAPITCNYLHNELLLLVCVIVWGTGPFRTDTYMPVRSLILKSVIALAFKYHASGYVVVSEHTFILIAYMYHACRELSW